MALYDLPGGRRFAALPLDVTVRLSLWGLPEDYLETLGKRQRLLTDGMVFFSNVVENRVDLKTAQDISNMLILLNSLDVRPQGQPRQSLWFQSSLDGFRDISYVGPFVHYCKLAIMSYNLHVDSLYVGKWGRGDNGGKEPVLFHMNNVGFSVLVDGMDQIKQALVLD